MAYAIAADNLTLGNTFIADSVNSLQITRYAWLSVAEKAAVPVVDVEIVCSDTVEHRHRVETRSTDIEGLKQPTWQQVIDRTYDDWGGRAIVVDTATRDVDDLVADLVSRLKSRPATVFGALVEEIFPRPLPSGEKSV